jgi:hypothetical protein
MIVKCHSLGISLSRLLVSKVSINDFYSCPVLTGPGSHSLVLGILFAPFDLIGKHVTFQVVLTGPGTEELTTN